MNWKRLIPFGIVLFVGGCVSAPPMPSDLTSYSEKSELQMDRDIRLLRQCAGSWGSCSYFRLRSFVHNAKSHNTDRGNTRLYVLHSLWISHAAESLAGKAEQERQKRYWLRFALKYADQAEQKAARGSEEIVYALSARLRLNSALAKGTQNGRRPVRRPGPRYDF